MGLTATTILSDVLAQVKTPVEALKCGCCLKSMQRFDGEAEILSEPRIFKRPCNCLRQGKCFMCNRCIDHCRCGQKIMVNE